MPMELEFGISVPSSFHSYVTVIPALEEIDAAIATLRPCVTYVSGDTAVMVAARSVRTAALEVIVRVFPLSVLVTSTLYEPARFVVY